MAGEVGGRPQGGVGPYVFVAELRSWQSCAKTNQVDDLTLQQCALRRWV